MNKRIYMTKTPLSLAAAILLQLLAITSTHAAEPKQVASPTVLTSIPDDADEPNAVILSVTGKCEYSLDGSNFTEIGKKDVFTIMVIRPEGNVARTSKPHLILNQGAIVRTGSNSRVDIFLRRMGTTVRLQENTEIKFEKMSRHLSDGLPVMETLLALRTGRIFTVVRSMVPGSTLEIRNAAGRSMVEGGGGKGRYIITADGTHVTDKKSTVPLKLIGESGITIIKPGMVFHAKEGKLLSLDTPEIVKSLIEFDELDSMMEQTSTPEELREEK